MLNSNSRANKGIILTGQGKYAGKYRLLKYCSSGEKNQSNIE